MAKCNVIQMVDVIIGGFAFAKNYPDAVKDPGASYKAELAKYILEQSGLGSLDRNTGPHSRWLTVWNFRHQRLIAKEKAPQSARRYVRQG